VSVPDRYPEVQAMVSEAADVSEPIVMQLLEALRLDAKHTDGRRQVVVCLARAAALTLILEAQSEHVMRDHDFPGDGALELLLAYVVEAIRARRHQEQPKAVH